MRSIFKIIFVLLLAFPAASQEKIRTGEVHLNDSTHIYYFDLFNDQRSFHWDTISPIFNFDNYRIYFKNNSTDTLLAGSATTGDGRVSYDYAGHHKLILPGEYLILRPFHNGSQQYRQGRFSKSVSMPVLCKDSTIRFRHRYVGCYNPKDTSAFVPRIELDEPLNTYPTQEERVYLGRLYDERMANSQANRDARRKQLQDELLGEKPVEVAIKTEPVKSKNTQTEMHIYFQNYMKKDAKVERIFSEDVNGERELKRIEITNQNPYYLLTNPDSLQAIELFTKNAEGRKHYVQKIEMTCCRDVHSDFRGSCSYYRNFDSTLVFSPEYLAFLESQKPVWKTFLVATRSNSVITEQCEMQALENGAWVEIPLKENEYKTLCFTYRTEIDSYRRQVRWKIKEDVNWNLDWIYLYRSYSQTLTVDSLASNIRSYGQVYLQFDQNYYRMEVVDDLHDWRTKESFVDSVKEVMRWYGIPIGRVNYNSLRLKNDEDKIRAQRALNRHFEKVTLLPMYNGHGESDWICPSARVTFLKDITEKQIKTLLKQIGFSEFYVFEHEFSDAGLVATIKFDDIISPIYSKRINTLYERKELFSLVIERCGMPRLDHFKPD